jgi:hypothetical protein
MALRVNLQNEDLATENVGLNVRICKCVDVMKTFVY